MLTYENLLNQLFGEVTCKNLNVTEIKALKMLGYDPLSWDNAISKGRLTKNDVKLRVELFKELDQKLRLMDEDVNKRFQIQKEQEQTKPKYKQGDTFKTKQHGTILVTTIHQNHNDWYVGFTCQDGSSTRLKTNEFEKLISER